MGEALKAYDKYIVCIDKTPEDFQSALVSLLNKAIKAYENRGPQLRHGIALDRQITVILSQNDGGPKPLCGIYFNLHSPYQKTNPTRPAKAVRESISGGTED
jgi:MoxR-like ATPase